MRRSLLFSLNILKLLNPVNMTIIPSQLIPLFIRIIRLDIRIIIQIIIQRNKCSCLIELSHCISAINKIWILTSGNQRPYRLRSCLTGKPCLVHLYTSFFCDNLLNLIVVIDFSPWNRIESCKFFCSSLILAASATTSGKQ